MQVFFKTCIKKYFHPCIFLDLTGKQTDAAFPVFSRREQRLRSLAGLTAPPLCTESPQARPHAAKAPGTHWSAEEGEGRFLTGVKLTHDIRFRSTVHAV